MRDHPPVHAHTDGVRHAHTTVLAPEIAAFLQRIEDFVGSLEPEEELALRRLLRTAMAAPAWAAADDGDDTVGYDHDWYRAWCAANHEHPAGTAAARVGAIYHYVPIWWPPGRARVQPSARPPPGTASAGPTPDMEPGESD